MSGEIATREPQALAVRYELEVEDLIAQVQKIQLLMAKVMKEGEHYGVIPGTGTKPTLLKPGAEKLCVLFRLAPDPESVDTYDGSHLTVKTKMGLTHIPTGQRWGSGEGSCSTKESKYAYRKAGRKCPACSKEDTIIKGKTEYGGGWVCFGRKGGCGAKFKDGDQAIESQESGRIANEDVADQYNTVLKMANKRALVAAVLNVTAASDIFTQDLEDLPAREAPRGEIIEAQASPAHDQDAQDRSRIVDQIDESARALKFMKSDYKKAWAQFVGEKVRAEDAPIDKLMALADHLAERIKAAEAGDPAPAEVTEPTQAEVPF